MASKQYFVDLDLSKQSLIEAKLHPLTTVGQTALAGTLGAGDVGLTSFNTTTSILMVWSGTVFIPAVPSVTGAMVYQGAVSSLVTAPGVVAAGSTYIYTGSNGDLSWSGISFSPNATIAPGDMVVFRTATDVDIVQGNTISATTSAEGTVVLATSGEVNTGADAAKVVTPSTLATWKTTKAIASTYFQSGVTLVAATPLTITHNLALQNKDSFVMSVKDSSGSVVEVDVDSITINTTSITANLLVAGATVTIIGF